MDGVFILLCIGRYFLLFEDTVESVIYARKNFLTKNGLIFPDRGILFVAAVEDEEYRDKKLLFWYFFVVIIFF
jgi:protein arginine N-methyltransferase 1